MRGQSGKDRPRVGEVKRNGRLLGATKTSGELAEWRRLHEKLEHTEIIEKKVASMPQSEQLASTKDPPLPKENGTKPSDQITEL